MGLAAVTGEAMAAVSSDNQQARLSETARVLMVATSSWGL